MDETVENKTPRSLTQGKRKSKLKNKGKRLGRLKKKNRAFVRPTGQYAI